MRVFVDGSSNLQVDTVPGTTWDGSTLTIALSAADKTVSGLVRDTTPSQNPVPALVVAFTPQGDFVTEAFTDASGAYTLGLAEGSYNIQIEPFSLPTGFQAPTAQTADMITNNTLTINFDVASAPATITGEVYYIDSGSEVGVPAWVEITTAANGNFVTGFFAAPDGSDFVYTMNVGPGSYRIAIDPGSVPAVGGSTLVVPAPVEFTVAVDPSTSIVTITEDNTTGSSNASDDGTINFELQSPDATLTGQVGWDDSGTHTGLSAFVEVTLDDGSNAVVAAAPTQGGGFFTFSLATGDYLLKVDPGSLPPGFLAPPPSPMSVVGSSISIGGVAVSGTYELVVSESSSAATLTGTVTDSTNGNAAVPESSSKQSTRRPISMWLAKSRTPRGTTRCSFRAATSSLLSTHTRFQRG